MKHILSLTTRVLVVCTIACFQHSFSSHLFLRSQSVDSARELAGWAHKVNLFDQGPFYGAFAVTPEYTRSFRSEQITDSLFPGLFQKNAANKCRELKVSGSCVANRNACDLLADYFGLPTDFQSTITLKPRIENFLVDLDLYFGLDEWMCGLWFRIHAPLVHARWNLNYNETIVDAGIAAYPAGYFSPDAVPRSNLLSSFGAFLSGQSPKLNNNVFFQPLAHSMVGCNSQTINGNTSVGFNGACTNCCDFGSESITRLSDIQLAFGLNFWEGEDYHFGLGVRTAAPTGNRPNETQYLFYPVIGNGHHWEVGGMLTTHYTFWRSESHCRSAGVYFDANITTLFDTRQCRVFDVCGAGNMSRYMLAAQYTPTITNHLQTNPACINAQGTVPVSGFTTPNAQFNKILSPVANLSFASVKVSIPVQADITLMFNYQHDSFEWDLGYNFWATGCEHIRLCTNTNIVQFNAWGLKGDANLFGFDNSTGSTFLPVALSASQSNATLFSGLQGCPTTAENFGNPIVDNPACAYGDGTSVTGTGTRALFSNTTVPVNTTTNPQTKTSSTTVFLSDANLNIQNAKAKGLSHALFTHINFTWSHDDHCFDSYLGVGTKIEFAHHNKPCNSTTCQTSFGCLNDCATNCNNSSISQWALWLKGGVAF